MRRVKGDLPGKLHVCSVKCGISCVHVGHLISAAFSGDTLENQVWTKKRRKDRHDGSWKEVWDPEPGKSDPLGKGGSSGRERLDITLTWCFTELEC